MKFGLGVNANETVSEIVEKSIEAERLGINYVWVADVPAQRYAQTVASAIAANTRNIRIGLGLLSPFLHTPSQIANSLSTLVEAYGERFELCIGPGDRNQLERVGVSLSHLKGITSHLLDAKDEIEKTLQKNKIETKVWLGAQGPKMLEIAHSFDGVLLNYAKPSLVKWAIDQVGPVEKTFQFDIYAPAYVYRRFDPNIYNLVRVASAIVALGSPKAVLKRLNLYEKMVEANSKLDEGSIVESILDDIPPETVELFSIFKSPKELEVYFSEVSRMKVDHVVFGYPQNFSKQTVSQLAGALKVAKQM